MAVGNRGALSMLNALSVFLSGGDDAGHARAARSFERQGFGAAEKFEWAGGTVAAWTVGDQTRPADSRFRGGANAAFCAGPLWYRGRFGAAALEAVVADTVATGSIDESALRGNFALFLHAGDKALLLNDGLGLVRIHASADGCFFSTSWLAACAYLDHVELDEAPAIEYVLLGAAHSCRTIACGVSLLPLGRGVDLSSRRTWLRFPQGFTGPERDFRSCQEAIDATVAHLRGVCSEIVAARPHRINAALSGGFDSRLIVAALLEAGARPNLFVYGGETSTDVQVAKTVASSLDLPLDVIDKSIMNRARSVPDLDALERNALFFDGLPNDGIDDPGADRDTRVQQTRDGSIALNGGGGEIFRNFFHLPNRSFSARDIVHSFYRGFSAAVFRHRGQLAEYESMLATSMREVLGLGSSAGQHLTRAQVELLYPLFRCHYWMGLNNSVATRSGYFMTPLIDPASVRLAQRVALRWKNAGAFEARLIAALHPAIAAQPTGYGFRFDRGPAWRDRLAARLIRARPAFLRPVINAAHRRVRRTTVTSALYRRYRQLFPGEWRMDRLLDLKKLSDDSALGRAMAVEVVWRRIL